MKGTNKFRSSFRNSTRPELSRITAVYHYFNCYHPNEALFPHDMPGVLIPHVGAYFRGSRGGNFLLGVQEKISKTLANDEFRHLDYETLSDLVNGMDDGSEQLIERYEQISELVPEFDEARIVSHHSGLSTYTPDGNYVIGEGKPNLKGYFVASGCCGSGVSSAGGVGEFVANMVCGETSHLAKKFDPARFGKTDFQGEEFKSMCVAARSSKLGKIIN